MLTEFILNQGNFYRSNKGPTIPVTQIYKDPNVN